MNDITIPISGPVFSPVALQPVQGGNSRMVPMVPIGDRGERLPCMWKSHYIVQAELSDGSRVPANECLLLLSKNPITTIRAEVAVDAWQHFDTGIIEW
jgi:hypothetical protein